MMNNFIINIWYKKNFFCWLLSPFMVIYLVVIFIRRSLYKKKILTTHKFKVPVIIIGNITVGGTGKTPVTIWLANYLRANGFKPGIVSRGYGSSCKTKGLARVVEKNMDTSIVGDEPLLLYLRTNCPVVVAKNRVLAVKKLLAIYDCDIIISDDGLQHYALGRDLEIVLVDGTRYFGNGLCLPAGPLREPINRLKEANLILINGSMPNHKSVNLDFDSHLTPEGRKVYIMELVAQNFCSVAEANIIKELTAFRNMTVHAVAGIGNPQNFFKLLRSLGLKVIEHVFPDHYVFEAKDIVFKDDLLVIMTEKDAVKCRNFMIDMLDVKFKYWFLSVEAQPNLEFINQVNVSVQYCMVNKNVTIQ